MSEGCSRETRCEMGGMNTGSEADNGEDKPRTTPSLETPCQPLTPSDTRSDGDLPYYGPENNICRQHAKLIVGAGCPDCYREWTMAEEEESKQPDSGPV